MKFFIDTADLAKLRDRTVTGLVDGVMLRQTFAHRVTGKELLVDDRLGATAE